MNRREFLAMLGGGALAGLTRPVRAADSAGAATKSPNVVLIISDDQAFTDHGFMGHETVRTPNLDALARRSLVITRSYVPTALCRPSLATIATGLYPHQHRIVGNDPAKFPRERMAERFGELDALPEMLSRAGYVSLQTGKWWEGAPANGGFTRGMTHGDPKRGGRHGDQGLRVGRKTMQPIARFLDDARRTDTPFFLWYAPFLPHTPHNPPKRLLDKYTAPDRPGPIAKYYAMCEWFDETCGTLLEMLDKRGLTENTLIAYVVDNGWVQSPDNKRNFDKLRAKRTAYERGVRTPIMLSLPGRIEPGRDEVNLASSIDLAPTLLAACGLDVPKELPGIDLRDPAARKGRDAVFGASYAHDVADLSDPTRTLQRRWVIQGWWKLLDPNRRTRPEAAAELYDLKNDPFETTNLAAGRPDRVVALRKRLDAWWPESAGA